jgi:hypothetical protein
MKKRLSGFSFCCLYFSSPGGLLIFGFRHVKYLEERLVLAAWGDMAFSELEKGNGVGQDCFHGEQKFNFLAINIRIFSCWI